MFSLATFEHQLVMYVTADDKVTFGKAFDINSVPVVTHEQALAEERTKKLTTATPTLKAPSSGAKKVQANGSADGVESALAQAHQYSEQLLRIPELKSHGNVLKSSSKVELTESETEYVVSVIKHIFTDHIVLQYEITNTLPDTVLEDVSVLATPADEDGLLEEEFIMPAERLNTGEPGTVYVSFKKISESPFAVTSFTNVLKFTSKEMDPTTGEPDSTGYEDEYQVEDVELAGSDYVLPAFSGSFDHVWEQTGAQGDEVSETLHLSDTKSIAGRLTDQHLLARLTWTSDATEQLINTLSLQPLDGTDISLNTSTHTLKLYGKSVFGGKVAAMIKMAYSAKSGVTTKISVRSEEEGLPALVVSSVS